MGELIVGLALRQRNLPSQWMDEEPAAILTALRLLEQQDREAQKEAGK